MRQENKSKAREKVDLSTLTQREREALFQATDWFKQNYIDFETGKYKKCFWHDVEDTMHECKEHLKGKYRHEFFDKRYYCINILARMLLFGWIDGTLPTEFDIILKGKHKETNAKMPGLMKKYGMTPSDKRVSKIIIDTEQNIEVI